MSRNLIRTKRWFNWSCDKTLLYIILYIYIYTHTHTYLYVHVSTVLMRLRWVWGNIHNQDCSQKHVGKFSCTERLKLRSLTSRLAIERQLDLIHFVAWDKSWWEQYNNNNNDNDINNNICTYIFSYADIPRCRHSERATNMERTKIKRNKNFVKVRTLFIVS